MRPFGHCSPAPLRRILFLTFGGLVIAMLLHAAESQPRTIHVGARKFSFEPSPIELKAGEPVTLVFESEDVKHGFRVEGLGVKSVTFRKGEPAVVSFTPREPGTYKFRCSRFCGLGHFGMTGRIVVK